MVNSSLHQFSRPTQISHLTGHVNQLNLFCWCHTDRIEMHSTAIYDACDDTHNYVHILHVCQPNLNCGQLPTIIGVYSMGWDGQL